MTPWQLLRTEPGSLTDPGALPADGWEPVLVPGALTCADGSSADDHAWWLRRPVLLPAGEHELVLDGIGTYAHVYVDGALVARSTNAFRRQVLALELAAGAHELAVRIGALTEVDVPRRPRARWRSALLPDATMRWRRSPHLGRIPSWQGARPYVGIIGEATLRPAAPRIDRVTCSLDVDGGRVEVVLVGHGCADAVVRVGDQAAAVVDGTARVQVPDAEAWMPHTHGSPATYELVVEHAGRVVDQRRIGFSRIEVQDPAGLPAVTVNDVPVFVRGACWVPTDAVAWVDDEQRVRADLQALRDAGLNAVRITGTNRYEPAAFWDAAAELGLLVWQDVMLATFDPPEDQAWLADLEDELRDQLGRLQGRPNVLAVCGGTETEQQPTLMGQPLPHITAIHETLPRVAAEVLPDAPLVPSSPSGGPLPTSVAAGFSHYFGVGAYLRPLDDARSARVAFASEALAFAIPPERATVRQDEPDGIEDVRADSWRDGVPSDRGVGWGFDDVTDHYAGRLFGLERDDVDADRWLDLERAAVADAMTSTFSIWRSASSPTGGGIVLAHTDLRSGPGWGLLDHHGRPKAPLLALRDVLAPTALLFVDHGLDGLWLDVVHDGPQPLEATLHVDVYAIGDRPVETAEVVVTGPTHLHVETALGGFRDLTFAWRFGDRFYRCVRARLVDAQGSTIAEATRLLEPASTVETASVTGSARSDDGEDLLVDVTAAGVAQFVHLDAPGWRPDIGWFHLAPGVTRTIRCSPEPGATGGEITVRATNAPATVVRTTTPTP